MKPGRSRRYPTPASKAIWRAILTKKHKDLSAKEDNHTFSTKEEIASIIPSSTWDITKRHTITLVNEMERAHRYMELKDFLFQQLQEFKCVPQKSINLIIDFVKADARFEKLDTEDIQRALTALHVGLLSRHYVVIPSDMTNEITNEMIINDPRLIHVVDDEKTCEKNQLRIDEYLIQNPIFRLVYETLKMDRVLHEEPEEELSILKNKMHPTFYYNHFISEEQEYKEKTVTFVYDECDASQEDIKTLLSVVGEILSVYITRSEQLHMAHVTFRDLKAANDAIYCAAQGELKLNGRPVTAVLTSYNKPTSDLPASMSQYTTAAMSSLEMLEEELFADARNRYATLVEKTNGRKMDNKRKRDSVLSDELESDDMQSG